MKFTCGIFSVSFLYSAVPPFFLFPLLSSPFFSPSFSLPSPSLPSPLLLPPSLPPPSLPPSLPGHDQPLTEWEHFPHIGPRPIKGYVGLKNAGATCYMNAVLQQVLCACTYILLSASMSGGSWYTTRISLSKSQLTTSWPLKIVITCS